jgi:PAS domain S-box-containing protein
MVLAYLLAPGIGRARVAQHQRVLAERVLGHVADAVVLVDEDGVVRFWNRAAEVITGVTARRAIGSAAEELVRGWSAAAEQIPITDAAAPGAATVTVPIDSEGRELWIAASAVRFADGVVYTFRDVSESERLDRAKADFVATVSHELRTPLASVYGAAMTLRYQDERLERRQRKALLELLGDQAARLSGIIDDILLASRLDAGGVELEHEQFDAADVTRHVVDAARIRAEANSIDLSLPEWLPEVAGDGDMVSQVLANLVENAMKYSPGGGRVDVTVDRREDRVRFEVRDEGLGIPLGEQERIFEKFYRLDPNLTRGVGGTGLGLYISSELVRRMGGEIQVHSAPGEGSTFWFELALADAAETARART